MFFFLLLCSKAEKTTISPLKKLESTSVISLIYSVLSSQIYKKSLSRPCVESEGMGQADSHRYKTYAVSNLRIKPFVSSGGFTVVISSKVYPSFQTIRSSTLVTFIYFTQSNKKKHAKPRNAGLFQQHMLVLSPGPPLKPHKSSKHSEVGRVMWVRVALGWCYVQQAILHLNQTTACWTLIYFCAKANTPSWVCSPHLLPLSRALLYHKSTESWLIKLRASEGQHKTAVCACMNHQPRARGSWKTCFSSLIWGLNLK